MDLLLIVKRVLMVSFYAITFLSPSREDSNFFFVSFDFLLVDLLAFHEDGYFWNQGGGGRVTFTDSIQAGRPWLDKIMKEKIVRDSKLLWLDMH